MGPIATVVKFVSLLIVHEAANTFAPSTNWISIIPEVKNPVPVIEIGCDVVCETEFGDALTNVSDPGVAMISERYFKN